MEAQPQIVWNERCGIQLAEAPVSAPCQDGFVRGIGHPSVFHHPARELVTLVHGDDYATAWTVTELLWFKKGLEDKYGIKTQLIGPKGKRNR